MFYYMAEVRPGFAHPKFGECDGAVVSCWMQRETHAEAFKTACDWIRNEHWETVVTMCSGPINREIQLAYLWHLPDGMRYLEQAEIEGEAFAVFSLSEGWPPER